MRLTSKLILTALAATVTMAFAVSNASANTLRTSSLDVYIIWESLVLGAPIGDDVNCEVTLLGSFHRETITKEVGALIGNVTHGSIGACEEGEATIHQESLPWHITFGGWEGVLPTIETAIVNLLGAEFGIANGTATCDAITEEGEPGVGTGTLGTGGRITNLAASGSIDLIPGDGICDLFGANGEFRGDGDVEDDTTIDGTGVAITLV